jgi:cullin-4
VNKTIIDKFNSLDSLSQQTCTRLMRNTALHLTNSSSTNQNSKRLVIKNLREPFKPANEDLFGQLWPSLEQAIKAIQHKHSIALSLEILYRHVENLCAAKKESQLYDSLKQICEEHITDLIPELTKYPFLPK